VSYNYTATGCPNERAVDTAEYHQNNEAHQVRLSEERQIRAIRAGALRTNDRFLENRCSDTIAGCTEGRKSLLDQLTEQQSPQP